jgi:beta-fructofuranosidase
MEIIAEIDPDGSPQIEIDVLRSPDKEEFTRILFSKYYEEHGGKSMITIDSSCSSNLPDVDFRPPESGPVLIDKNEPLKLRVFIDKSVLEVFVNDIQCVAVRVYPGREDSIGVSLRSQGEDALLKSIDAWQMKNIYK